MAANTKTPAPPTDPPADIGGEGLRKITVNLIPKADRALTRGAELSGDTRTNTINRALQVYAYVLEQQAAGKDVWFGTERDLERGKVIRLKIL